MKHNMKTTTTAFVITPSSLPHPACPFSVYHHYENNHVASDVAWCRTTFLPRQIHHQQKTPNLPTQQHPQQQQVNTSTSTSRQFFTTTTTVQFPPSPSSPNYFNYRNRTINAFMPISSRMRNPGGFSLPPRIPDTPDDMRRAIELLGSYTQSSQTRIKTRESLISFIGELPSSRLLAQQWKISLQRLYKKQQTKSSNSPNEQQQQSYIHTATTLTSPLSSSSSTTTTNINNEDHTNDLQFRHRDALILQLPILPRAPSDLSRLFILLEVIRKRYSTNSPIPPRLTKEVTARLGNTVPPPASVLEARRYIRALAHMQRLRRRVERRPPHVPLHDLEALRVAHMLLGAFAVNGGIGKQTNVLQSLIGGVPPSTNVAASWKKVVAAAIRKKKRKDRVGAKRIVDDEKRLQRRLKRVKREREKQSQDLLDQLNGLQQHDELSGTGTVQKIVYASLQQNVRLGDGTSVATAPLSTTVASEIDGIEDNSQHGEVESDENEKENETGKGIVGDEAVFDSFDGNDVEGRGRYLSRLTSLITRLFTSR